MFYQKLLLDLDRIESSYVSDGCRLVWTDKSKDNDRVIFLRNADLEQLLEILSNKSTGKIELEDETSYIMINEDTVEFQITGQKPLYADPKTLKEKLADYGET